MVTLHRIVDFCLLPGLKKGWGGFVWMLKILIPISFLTMLLDYSGWLSHLDFLLAPAMSMLNLPPTAALPLIVGMLTGIYGGIAAMSVLSFTQAQMTLIAVFLLISHNLIQEGVVQAKSGLHGLKATCIRLSASVLTLLVIIRFAAPEQTAAVLDPGSGAVQPPFLAVLNSWSLAMLALSLKIFTIVMILMVLLETMKYFHLIERLVRILTPVLRILGLSPRVGFLWLTAAVFGLAYGAAVIVEEAKTGALTRRELEQLHLSIGINHAMVEDPILFLPLGISPFWLWVPRLAAAVVAAHLYRLFLHLKRSALFAPSPNYAPPDR